MARGEAGGVGPCGAGLKPEGTCSERWRRRVTAEQDETSDSERRRGPGVWPRRRMGLRLQVETQPHLALAEHPPVGPASDPVLPLSGFSGGR